MKTQGYTIEDGKVVERDYWDSKEEAYEALVAELHSQVAALAAFTPPVTPEKRIEQLELAFPPAKTKRRHECRLAWRLWVQTSDGKWYSCRHFLQACRTFAGNAICDRELMAMYGRAIADTPKETAEKRCEVLREIQRLSGAKQPIERVLSYGLDGKEYNVEMEEAKKEAEA